MVATPSGFDNERRAVGASLHEANISDVYCCAVIINR